MSRWRNSYSHKVLKNSVGKISVSVPRDRDSSFTLQAVPKRQIDVSSIEGKMRYARDMNQRNISSTTDAIYGFTLSAG